jgi:hypothetical protein
LWLQQLLLLNCNFAAFSIGIGGEQEQVKYRNGCEYGDRKHNLM